MKLTLTKVAAGLVLAVASAGALAAPVSYSTAAGATTFRMFDPTGAIVDANGNTVAGTLAAVTGVIDRAAGTFTLASSDLFSGFLWTANGGTLYGEGTHTVNVNGDGADGAGDGNVTFTVGAGQLGGNINFNWNGTFGIDVFNVWNVTSTTAGGFITTTYTSTNMNAVAGSVLYNGVAVATDVIPGLKMVDGPFKNFSANFKLTTVVPVVPEASTYGMMLAGLGLVGFAVRRRKLMA